MAVATAAKGSRAIGLTRVARAMLEQPAKRLHPRPMSIAESHSHGVAPNEFDTIGADIDRDRHRIEQRLSADLVNTDRARTRKAKRAHRKATNMIRV